SAAATVYLVDSTRLAANASLTSPSATGAKATIDALAPVMATIKVSKDISVSAGDEWSVTFYENNQSGPTYTAQATSTSSVASMTQALANAINKGGSYVAT